MNSKTLFICLAILAVLSCTVQGLIIDNQKSLSYKARVSAHKTVQTIAYFHDSNDISPKVQKDLAKLFQEDQDIRADLIAGRPFSKASSDKIQQFFLNDQQFINGLVTSYEKDPKMPQCFKKTSRNQKQKYAKILVKSMDFEKVLNGDNSLSKSELGQIKKAVGDDKDLGPQFLKCLDTPLVGP